MWQTINMAAEKDSNADIAEMPFEQAREQLGLVVARLEAGGEPLETSLELWERGEALAARCQAWLDSARERLAKVTGGEPTALASTTGEEPF